MTDPTAALEFFALPDRVADRLGLPRGKSVPLTPQTRARLVTEGPTVEAIVEGCEAYLAVDPEDADYRKFLARYWHHRGASTANDGRVAEALGMFDKSREYDPTDPQVHMDYAQAAAELDRAEDAIQGFRMAMGMGEKSPAAWDGLSRAFAMKGDHASAKKAAEEGRKAFPDSVLMLHTLSTVLYHAGDKAAVEKILFEALAKEPSNLLTLEKLGVWMRECGRFEEAFRAIRRALELAPGELRLLYQRGMTEFRSGDRAIAEKTFAEIMKAEPGHLDTRTALAVLMADSSKLAEAEKLFRETTVLAPADYRAWFHLGRLCARDAERIEEALGYFAKALDIGPRDRHAVRYMYVVAKHAGDARVSDRAEAQMRAMGDDPNAAAKEGDE